MRPRLPLYAFTATYLVTFAVLAAIRFNPEFLYYAVVLALIIAGVMTIDRRVHFSTPVLWGLSIWGLMHLAGGTLPVPASLVAPDATHVLYNLRPAPWLPKYDQITHAYGFGVTTLACWQAVRAAGVTRPTPGTLILIVAAGMGFGAINEVIEFAATRLMPQTNVGGYTNTGWDLVSNLIGAITAATIVRLTASAPTPASSPRPRGED